MQRGISNDEKDHQTRVQAYGENKKIKRTKTIWEFMQENFEDDMLRILSFLALVSLILEMATQGLNRGWLESASVLVAIMISVFVTSVINYFKDKQFTKLNTAASYKGINVHRGGDLMNVSVEDVYVGDIV